MSLKNSNLLKQILSNIKMSSYVSIPQEKLVSCSFSAPLQVNKIEEADKCCRMISSLGKNFFFLLGIMTWEPETADIRPKIQEVEKGFIGFAIRCI